MRESLSYLPSLNVYQWVAFRNCALRFGGRDYATCTRPALQQVCCLCTIHVYAEMCDIHSSNDAARWRDGASALAERHDYLILISYLHMRTSRIMYEYANSHSVRAVSVGACVRVCVQSGRAARDARP